MNQLADRNDRLRRRQARLITFFVTSAMLIGGLFAMGAADQMIELINQLMGTAPAATEAIA